MFPVFLSVTGDATHEGGRVGGFCFEATGLDVGVDRNLISPEAHTGGDAERTGGDADRKVFR